MSNHFFYVSNVPATVKSLVKHKVFTLDYPVGIYMFKVKNRNTRKRCEVCSRLTIKTPERHHRRRSVVVIANFKHISHLVVMLLLLTLRR